jgi:hypothetical protein
LRTGQPLYCTDIAVGGGYCAYSYSPFFATLLIPFSYIPLPLLDFLWLIANALLLFRIWTITAQQLNWVQYPLKQQRILNFLLLLFTVRFILYNFDLSQVTILLLWASLEAIRLIQKNKWQLGALILATAISIKIMPLVLLPYLFYRKHYKAALATTATIILLNLLPALAFGWQANLQMLQDWQETINPNNPEFTVFQNESGEMTHGLSSFIAAYFYQDGIVRHGLSRIIYPLNIHQIIQLNTAARLLFILLTLYFLRTPPLQPAKSSQHAYWEIAYILLITPLIFPHQQKYGFIFVLPAIAYLLNIISESWLIVPHPHQPPTTSHLKKIIGNSALMLIFILTTLSSDLFIGWHYYEIAQYYKLITWGTLLLVVTLAYFKPLSPTKTAIAV